MNNRILFTTMLLMAGLITTFAQTSSDASPLKGDLPINYMTSGSGESDIDIYYEYKIWRTLPLEVTPNQPLALPLEPVKNKKNLGMVILESVGNEDFPIPVHNYSDQEMEEDPQVASSIYSAFNLQKKVEDRCFLFQPTGETFTIIVADGDPRFQIHKDSLFSNLNKLFTEKTVKIILSEMSNQIYKYDLYEVWFFNKRYSTFKSEIRAICPYVKDPTSGQPMSIGWIPFNQLRRYLVQVPIKLSDWHATTGMNQYSMDAYFTSRLYSGEIIQAENLQGKRFIDYTKSPDEVAKLRQEIETKLINLEEDIWAY